MILLGILWACQSAPSTNHSAELYGKAVQASTLEESAALCKNIHTEATRHECLAFLAQSHGRDRPVATETICADLPLSIWRDECFFLLSEAISSPGTPHPSAKLCRRAGRYRKPCFMHLFAGHVGYLRSEHTLREAMERYVEAIELGGQDSPKDFAHQAWSLFFSKPDHVVIDIQHCMDLGDSRTQCISGAREALRRRLNQAAQGLKDGSSICEDNETSPAQGHSLVTTLSVNMVPHPLLDSTLHSFRHAHCRTRSIPSPH